MTPIAIAGLTCGALGLVLGVCLGLIIAARILRWWGRDSSPLMDSVEALIEERRRGRK